AARCAPRAPVTAGLAACVLAAAVLVAAKGAEASAAAWIADKERTVGQLVADMAPRLRPGDRVQVLDTTEGGVHALLRLGVAPATRFVYDFHFFHDVDHPTVRGLRAELVRALDAAPPRLVVVFARGWPGGGLERVHAFPELAGRLAGRYREVVRRPAYVIHERREG
ncbi:MAG TPA: hypothetical protein VNN07_13915, partial [Candidatus Tectomicrobia bacterium]|nr:hypothetical protein [Candidatus Tectomicrobia bacterium]